MRTIGDSKQLIQWCFMQVISLGELLILQTTKNTYIKRENN